MGFYRISRNLILQDTKQTSGQLLDISPGLESKALVDIFSSPTATAANGVRSTTASTNGEPAVDNYPDVLKLVLQSLLSYLLWIYN